MGALGDLVGGDTGNAEAKTEMEGMTADLTALRADKTGLGEQVTELTNAKTALEEAAYLTNFCPVQPHF